MRHLKRLSAWSDDHPLASFIIGFLALLVFAMVCLPSDPPYVQQAGHVTSGSVRNGT